MATVTVSFGNDTRSNDAITAGWIHSAIEAQRLAGEAVCGTVRVEGGGISVSLPVGSCPAGPGGRPPNAAESEVIELYRRRHLDQTRFSPGELEAFAKQAQRF